MSCPTSCTPLKRVLNDRVIPLDGKIPCLGKTLKGQYCKAPLARDRQSEALCLLECCIYCSRPGGRPLKYAIKDLAILLVHQQHSGEQDAAYTRWRNMVKEYKNKREKPPRKHHRELDQTLDRPQEYYSDMFDDRVAPQPVKHRRDTHIVKRSESDRTSRLSYPATPRTPQHRIEANEPIEDDKPAQHTVIHPTPPSSELPTESCKSVSVSVQTEAHEVYTPITLWSCLFGLILQCGVMICSLFKIQLGLVQFCDRAGNVKKGSLDFKFELGIRWTLTGLMPRWVIFMGTSFVALSVLLGSWLGLLCICWIGVQLQESPIELKYEAYRLR
ncbi:hypothetical protein ACN38_g378 [Penicillium nordicum]|uniref:Uncharacterized protein n=1 Tax=Penicillium nordicum TaxID=229535 RepID=A0A0M9WKV9_9EURO|nr:hypothetical protein ACN38_g378 [Penicillium nordicum]